MVCRCWDPRRWLATESWCRMEVHFTSKDCTHMKRLLMKSWKRDFPMLHSHEIFVCFTLLPYMIYKVLGMLGTVARRYEMVWSVKHGLLKHKIQGGCMRRRELTATIGGGLVGRRVRHGQLRRDLAWANIDAATMRRPFLWALSLSFSVSILGSSAPCFSVHSWWWIESIPYFHRLRCPDETLHHNQGGSYI